MRIRFHKSAWLLIRYRFYCLTHVLVVLGLAEMELIFLTAALLMLCFVLVTGKVLVTQQCFGYC